MLLHYRVCHNIFSERSLHNGFNLLGFIGQKNKNLICGSDNISVIAVFIFQLFAVINRGFTQRIFAKLFRKTRFCEQRKIQACNSFSVLLLCVCVFGFQRCLEFWCNAQISRYLCIVIGGVPTLKGVGIILITRFFRYGLRHNRRLTVLNLLR